MIVYNAVILAALLVGLLLLCWNLHAFRVVGKVEAPQTGAAPFISVLVPARNEALRIAPCASSLACQRYPRFEVLVMDDHSEDGTAEVLKKLGYSEEPGTRLRILRSQPLPPGWSGKSWACQQLAGAARGDYLLFTDADTEHAPEMLASALAMARETRADLLSAWPRLVTLTWSEKLVLPVIHLALVYYPQALWQWVQGDPARAAAIPGWLRRSLGAANGQFLWFKKEVYEQIGGHAAAKGHMVEDLALGRAVAARVGEGLRLVNCDGSRIAQVRMYSCFAEVWEGFTKNIRAAFENSLPLYLLMGLGSTATFLLPFALVWATHGLARGLVLAQIAVIYAMRARLAARFKTSWFGCLLHPAGQLITTAIALNSWRCSAGKGVTWKGRRYAVVHPGEP